MKKQDKAAAIQNILNEYFPDPPIPLDHKDPYTLLIAVLLSAQCTDVRVNSVTPALFAMADSPEKMITHTVEEIRTIIRPCGLSPQKSKAIWLLSEILIKKHKGQVPKNFVDLEELPGVGHKTASVVMSHAFGFPAFPVDTHIHRLAYRWGLSNGKNVESTEKDLKKLYLPEFWEKLHLQFIYFGREYCPARKHTIKDCPVCQKYAIRTLKDS